MKTSCISTASAVFPEPSRLFGNKNKCMELFCLMLILNLGLRRWKGKDWLLDKPVAIKRKMVNKKNYFYDLIVSAIRHWNTWFLIVMYTGTAGPRNFSWCSKALVWHKTSSTGSQTCQSALNWWESWTRWSLHIPSFQRNDSNFSILSINYT